jgi:AraC-like DNA-binding protein
MINNPRVMPLAPAAVDSPSRTLVKTGQVTIGEFRCAPSTANFRSAGAITAHTFVFPRRGVWIQHEGAPAFVADPTRITLYNPGQPYERRALDPDGDQSDWIALSGDIVREVVGCHDPNAADSPDRVLRFPFAPSPAQLHLAQRRLYEYIGRTPAPDILYVEERAITLFADTMAGLYARANDGATRHRRGLTRRNRETVEAVCAYLNRTFAENHSLGSIARAVGSSVFHLCRIFRRATGVTVHEYRHHLRLRHALDRLAVERDLLTIALDVGYSGHSHFTAAFRRHFGDVPSRVREAAERSTPPPLPTYSADSVSP